jgi:hypothetical protein
MSRSDDDGKGVIRRSKLAVGFYFIFTAVMVGVAVLALLVLEAMEPVPQHLIKARIRSEFCKSGCKHRYQLYSKADQANCAHRCTTHQLTKANFAEKEEVCKPRCPESDSSSSGYLTSADPCMVDCLAEELAAIEKGWEVKPLPAKSRAGEIGDLMLADPMQRQE